MSQISTGIKEKPLPAVRFKATLVNLTKIMADEIRLAVSEKVININNDILSLGIELINLADEVILTNGFINRSYTPDVCYWPQVKVKDINFFCSKETRNVLFGDLSSNVVDEFVKLINSQFISEDIMNALWEHLFALIKISISYVYTERKPVKHVTPNGYEVRYSVDYRQHIDIEQCANEWGVDLSKA